jgi:hypothetical protein
MAFLVLAVVFCTRSGAAANPPSLIRYRSDTGLKYGYHGPVCNRFSGVALPAETGVPVPDGFSSPGFWV